MKFIKFKPIYFERIWGGSKLKDFFKRDIDNSNIGESWEISDRPNANSIAIDGKFSGMCLSKIIQENQEYIMGKKWGLPFPILVKWIDAQQPLSIQVHPCPSTANLLNVESKSENWFVVQTDENSTIIAGLKPTVKSADKSDLTDSAWLKENLNEINAKNGEILYE